MLYCMLCLTFDCLVVQALEFQKFLRQRVDSVLGGSLGPASIKLRDRVLKDGKVLPNKIIDVSSFMDSLVDVNLMDECAKELVCSKACDLFRAYTIETACLTSLRLKIVHSLSDLWRQNLRRL